MARVERRNSSRRLHLLVGEVVVPRLIYQASGVAGLCPQDGALSLPKDSFSMGVRLEDIRHGLRTFDTTFFQAPGRLNVYDEHPFRVLYDYGHNAHAVGALCQLVNRMGIKGRRICVLSAPGDRRDEDIHAIGAVAAAAGFEHYICRRDDSLRGRADDEVPAMLAAALRNSGIEDARITLIADEQQAIEANEHPFVYSN